MTGRLLFWVIGPIASWAVVIAVAVAVVGAL